MEIQLLEYQNGVYPLPLQSLYHQSESREIRLVGLLCKLVVIGREYTFDIVTFHDKTESTNTTKQIYTLIFLHH